MNLLNKINAKKLLLVLAFIPGLIIITSLAIMELIQLWLFTVLVLFLIGGYVGFYIVWGKMGSKKVSILGGSEVGKTAFILTLNEILMQKKEGGPADTSSRSYLNTIKQEALNAGPIFRITDKMRTLPEGELLKLEINRVESPELKAKLDITISLNDISGRVFEQYCEAFAIIVRDKKGRIDEKEISETFLRALSPELRQIYRRIIDTVYHTDIIVAIIDPARYVKNTLLNGELAIHKALNEQFAGLSTAISSAIESSRGGLSIFSNKGPKGVIVIFNKKDKHKIQETDANRLFEKQFSSLTALAAKYNIPIRVFTSSCAEWNLHEDIDKIGADTGLRNILFGIIKVLKPRLKMKNKTPEQEKNQSDALESTR